jgi:hypothetical protein
MFVIEKASEERQPAERVFYPFREMFVGDSILIQDFRRAESARVAAIQFAKRRGGEWKFTLRKTREGWRIFRIG